MGRWRRVVDGGNERRGEAVANNEVAGVEDGGRRWPASDSDGRQAMACGGKGVAARGGRR